MLARMQAWLDQLQLDPEKTSLRSLLPTINVVLVLLVIILISASAVGLLRSLANEQGMTRVQLAGTSAREELRKLGEDTFTQARNAARNDSVRRALQDGSTDTLPALLKRTCQAAGLSACALIQGDHVLAQSAHKSRGQIIGQSNDPHSELSSEPAAVDEVPWSIIITAEHEQGERFLSVPAENTAPLMGAAVTVVANTEAPQLSVRLFGIRYLDDALASKLSSVGVTVHLLNYRAFNKAPVDAFTRLHAAGLSDGRYAAERINSQNVFAASVPVFASTGEAIVLIQSEIPTNDSDATARSLSRRLLLTAIVVGILAVIASLLLGQLVARPLRNLTDAATRLAQGDFSTSIPTSGPAEVGVLSRTMEDMRRNLVELTGTLRRREAEAQAVLSGTIEGVFAVDKNRALTYINPQGARMLGVSVESVMGKFCGDVLKPCADAQGNKPCDTVQCPILQARNSNSAQASERLNVGSGVIKTTVITSAGLVDGLQVQVMRDETELEAIRRARDSVLANISHEFRTPLAAQLASIELLLDGLDDYQPEQVRNLVMSLERGAQRLTSLIDNLLESVRIESGQLGIRHQSVALDEIVREAQNLIGSLLTQRSQTLEISVSDELPHIEGDELRLTQVFVNLLANANKYAPPYSVIRVAAEVRATALVAWVEDEGPGIAESHLHSIFDRFARGNSEPEPGGLGLGLWIVKSIVERHGGSISAERTLERRTRFSISLPLPGNQAT